MAQACLHTVVVRGWIHNLASLKACIPPITITQYDYTSKFLFHEIQMSSTKKAMSGNVTTGCFKCHAVWPPAPFMCISTLKQLTHDYHWKYCVCWSPVLCALFTSCPWAQPLLCGTAGSTVCICDLIPVGISTQQVLSIHSYSAVSFCWVIPLLRIDALEPQLLPWNLWSALPYEVLLEWIIWCCKSNKDNIY